MKIQTIVFSAAMLLPVTAQATSITFNSADLVSSTVNATLDLATTTVGGLTLSAEASNGGVLDTYTVLSPNGIAIGAPSNGNVDTDSSGSTNPTTGDYSLSFSSAITSIEVTFAFLSNLQSPAETISMFAADGLNLLPSQIGFTNTNDTSFSGGIISTSGRFGSGVFSYSGAAFNSFSFHHAGAGKNLGFGITNVTVQAVPLPAALPLLAGGLGLLGLVGWRRKRGVSNFRR